MGLSFLNPSSWFNSKKTVSPMEKPAVPPKSPKPEVEDDGIDVEQDFEPEVIQKEKDKQTADKAIHIGEIDAAELFSEYLIQSRDMMIKAEDLRVQGREQTAPYSRDGYLRAARLADDVSLCAEELAKSYGSLIKTKTTDLLDIMELEGLIEAKENEMRVLRRQYELAIADAEAEAEIAKQVNPQLVAERKNLRQQIEHLNNLQTNITSGLTVLETQIAKITNGLFAAWRINKMEKLQTEAKSKELALTKIQQELNWLNNRLEKITPQNDDLIRTGADQKFFNNQSAK